MDPFSLTLWPRFQQLFPHVLHDDAVIDDVTIDSRTSKGSQSLFVALRGRRGDGHMYVEEALTNGARFALVSERWQPPSHIDEKHLIRCQDTLETLQDLARCVRITRAGNKPVIAVAGCTGKTMLKDLLSHLFSGKEGLYTSPESYNSQIGVALSLINMPKHVSIAFIELAANKPGEMQKLLSMVQPTHSIVTNFFRQRYGIEEVKNSVVDQLFELINSSSQQVWSLVEDHEIFRSHDHQPKNAIFWNKAPVGFPTISSSSITSSGTRLVCQTPSGKKHSIHLSSTYPFMIEQVQIALATCYLLQKETGIDVHTAIGQLNNYRPQTIRTEVWKNPQGITFINGTYSHEALSFAASLEEMSTLLEKPSPGTHKNIRRALIFGGLKTALFGTKNKRRVIDAIHHLHVSDIFSWPIESLNFLDSDYATQKGIRIHSVQSIEEAIEKAITHPENRARFDAIIFKGADKLSVDWLFQKIEDSPPQTYACINLAALRHNLDLLRIKLGPTTRLMIMVKALAYGTDDIRIAHFLRKCGIDILGVSYVDEGVGMRKKGVEQNIFVINAMPHEMTKAVKWNLEIGVGSYEQIEAIKDAVVEAQTTNPGFKMKVHLHVDTGMKRFGCHIRDASSLGVLIHRYSEFLEFEGLFTHFCCADDPLQDEFTQWQASQLERIYDDLKLQGISPRHIHAANSAAAVRFSLPYCTMARIGLATYGIYSSASLKEIMPTLRPALSLVTKVAGLNWAEQGDTVSYGRTHTIKNEKALVAVLPIGYYDGLHRAYSEKVEVLIRGHKAPMIGKICMDYMMVDVTHIPDIEVGDSALIFGEDEIGNTLPLEEFAERGGSIAHELMTCLGPRIQRLFIYDESLRTR